MLTLHEKTQWIDPLNRTQPVDQLSAKLFAEGDLVTGSSKLGRWKTTMEVENKKTHCPNPVVHAQE